jgi:hypothetical protein
MTLVHCITYNCAHTPEGDTVGKQRVASLFAVPEYLKNASFLLQRIESIYFHFSDKGIIMQELA